jgi:hypothetical protein
MLKSHSPVGYNGYDLATVLVYADKGFGQKSLRGFAGIHPAQVPGLNNGQTSTGRWDDPTTVHRQVATGQAVRA